jgi:hypothetical protein
MESAGMEAIKWFASISGMIAAAMIAWNGGRRLTGWGFVIFVAASTAWIVSGFVTGENALAVQNIVLFGINLVGVYRYLIRKDPVPAS